MLAVVVDARVAPPAPQVQLNRTWAQLWQLYSPHPNIELDGVRQLLQKAPPVHARANLWAKPSLETRVFLAVRVFRIKTEFAEQQATQAKSRNGYVKWSAAATPARGHACTRVGREEGERIPRAHHVGGKGSAVS